MRCIDLQPKDTNGMVSFNIQSHLIQVLNHFQSLIKSTVVIEAVICFVLFQCDPYIKISLGRRTRDDRDNYKPNTLNPEFGRLDCNVPS